MQTLLTKKAIIKINNFGIRLKWLPIYLYYLFHGHRWTKTIFTHMTLEERLLLYSLGLKQSPGAVLLEVGSYLGASATFLAAAAVEMGGDTKVHCVDTWKNEGMTEGIRDTWNEFQKNTQRYSSVIVTHQGFSVEIAKTFGEPIDLLFLDGDHSYEGCRADVLAWLPHLRPGGVLVMHDFGWAEGVQRVVRELVDPRRSEANYILQNTYWTHL